jgi:hypothetical protein
MAFSFIVVEPLLKLCQYPVMTFAGRPPPQVLQGVAVGAGLVAVAVARGAVVGVALGGVVGVGLVPPQLRLTCAPPV